MGKRRNSEEIQHPRNAGGEALTFRGRRRGLGRRGPSTRRSCGREGEGGSVRAHGNRISAASESERERQRWGSWLGVVCLLHPAVAAVEDEAARAAAEGRNQRIGGGQRRRHGWRRRRRRQDSLRVASQRLLLAQFQQDAVQQDNIRSLPTTFCAYFGCVYFVIFFRVSRRRCRKDVGR